MQVSWIMWKVKYVNINSKNKWALVKLWIIKSWCNVGLKRLFHFLLTWFGWCQNIKMFLSSKIYVCISTWFVMWLLVSKYDNVSHFGNFFIIDWQIFILSTSFSQHFFYCWCAQVKNSWNGTVYTEDKFIPFPK